MQIDTNLKNIWKHEFRPSLFLIVSGYSPLLVLFPFDILSLVPFASLTLTSFLQPQPKSANAVEEIHDFARRSELNFQGIFFVFYSLLCPSLQGEEFRVHSSVRPVISNLSTGEKLRRSEIGFSFWILVWIYVFGGVQIEYNQYDVVQMCGRKCF